jgi:hypothetical protein
MAESASAVESVNAAEKRRMQAVKPLYADRRPLELTAEEAHDDKMESRALIDRLIGYNSTKILRIWLPKSHTAIRTRDVVFCPNTIYNGSIVYADLRVARTVKTVLDIADYEGKIEDMEIRKLLELSAVLSLHSTEMQEEDGVHDQLMEELLQQSTNGDQSLQMPGGTLERSIDPGGLRFAEAGM